MSAARGEQVLYLLTIVIRPFEKCKIVGPGRAGVAVVGVGCDPGRGQDQNARPLPNFSPQTTDADGARHHVHNKLAEPHAHAIARGKTDRLHGNSGPTAGWDAGTHGSPTEEVCYKNLKL